MGADGQGHDDNSGGQSCSDANKPSENDKPSATVTDYEPPSDLFLAVARGAQAASPVADPRFIAQFYGASIIGGSAYAAYGLYAGSAALATLPLRGAALAATLFKAGQELDQVVQTSKGPVRFVAEVEVQGSQLILKDILVYGTESGDRLQVGVKEVLQAGRELLDMAKQAGFDSVRFIADRSALEGSANPGRSVDFTRSLR